MGVVGNVEPLSLKEFRRLDLNSEDLGMPVQHLMANAGKALAEAIVAARKTQTVTLLCGKGNNGGDGFAAAGLLERWEVPYRVVLMEPREAIRGDAPRAFLDLLPDARIVAWKGARRAPWEKDLIVDCMLGSGIQGRPRPPYDAAIQWCNERKGVIACDVPSGLGSSLAVKPTTTVTFHAPKHGMSKATCGRIQVVDIGIPLAAATEIGRGDLDAGFVRSAADRHKGDNGRVLVVGGGPFQGAPYYAGMAALRSGADLVHVAAPADAAQTIRGWGPDLMVHDACPGAVLDRSAVPVIEDLMQRVDTLVIGPGLGTQRASRDAARAIIDAAGRAGKSIVVDADGLDAIDEAILLGHGPQMVLTPHGKEFEDLAGRAATQDNVAAFARRHGTTVLRKGAVDIVSGLDATRLCRRGDPAMTVGGTGDVLAGAVGALLSRGADPFDAACAGIYLVDCAGELAAGIRGPGMIARDVIEVLPVVLGRLD